MDVSINGAKILAVYENVPIFGTVQITQTLAASWLILIIISGLCIWLGSGLKVTGISRKQAVAEMIVFRVSIPECQRVFIQFFS